MQSTIHKFFTNEILKTIGEKYGKAVAQVALRYLIQRGVVVISKTVTKERMIQKFNVFDFSLTDENMEMILTLNQKESLFFFHYDSEIVKSLTGAGK